MRCSTNDQGQGVKGQGHSVTQQRLKFAKSSSITPPRIVRFCCTLLDFDHVTLEPGVLQMFKVKCQRSRVLRENVIGSQDYCSLLGNRGR